MNPEALVPYGRALWDYFTGDTDARLIIRRDDGLEIALPVQHFFRSEKDFSMIEKRALSLAVGDVLDAGAGTGLHTLHLQERGLNVTAIDIDGSAVDIMNNRGVRDCRRVDIMDFEGRSFGTILMLGHGIGMVENLQGLRRFLFHLRGLVEESGRLLIDTVDVRASSDPVHLAYHEANRRAGRYVGETRIRFEYRQQIGPYCGWLHVDPETLAEAAGREGYRCEILLQLQNGEYLASLTRHTVPS